MLWVLASQTRTIPSSDPESKRFPRAQYAKQVTALLEEKKKNKKEKKEKQKRERERERMNYEFRDLRGQQECKVCWHSLMKDQSYLKQSTISQWNSLR